MLNLLDKLDLFIVEVHEEVYLFDGVKNAAIPRYQNVGLLEVLPKTDVTFIITNSNSVVKFDRVALRLSVVEKLEAGNTLELFQIEVLLSHLRRRAIPALTAFRDLNLPFPTEKIRKFPPVRGSRRVCHVKLCA